MQMAGEQRIAASRERVWEALNDPEILRQCVPGCQSLSRQSEDRLRATVEIRIGPIGARFNGEVTLSDLNPPSGYTITGAGQAGIVGSAKGGARVRLADDGVGTLLTYDVDAEVGGRLAQLGGPIIDATAKQLAGQFFSKFGAIVEAPAGAAAMRAGSPTEQTRAASVASARQPQAMPISWILGLAVAALCGYLIGRGQADAAGSDWVGLSIGLFVIVIAIIAFASGRRAATPTIVLDAEMIARLAEGGRR